MSYEVYIDVKHGDKHAHDLERKDTCFRFPDGREPMEHVVSALRVAADEWDPNFVCIHCGVRRADHHQERGQSLCSRYGQVARFTRPKGQRDPDVQALLDLILVDLPRAEDQRTDFDGVELTAAEMNVMEMIHTLAERMKAAPSVAGPVLGYTVPVSAEEVGVGDYVMDDLPEWVDPDRGSRVVRVGPYTPITEEGEDRPPEMVQVTLAHGRGGPTRRLYRPEDRIRVRRC